MAKKGVLQDERGLHIYPMTKSSCVYLEDNRTVENVIGDLEADTVKHGDSLPGESSAPINADTLGGYNSAYFSSAAEIKMFKATLKKTNWQKIGDTWIQTAPCEGMRTEFYVTAPQVLPRTNFDEDYKQLEFLNSVNMGVVETFVNEIKVTVTDQPPEFDVTLYMRRVIL